MVRKASLQLNKSVGVGQQDTSIFADLKALFKGLVLISNVLPVFTGFWLALYFTNTSLADQWQLLLITIVGSTLLMGGALILNNWYDVDIDTVMKRTQHRPTVTGNISLRVVLWLGISLSVIGQLLLLFTTVEAAVYGFIGWITYVVFYTMWTKRRYTWNTLVGSVSGAVTPLIGWAAVEPASHIVPIILFLILFVWQMPHTYAIAIKKYDEYKAAKVAMLPVVRGIDVAKRQMVLYIACLLPLPFFLIDLGISFVLIALVLTIGWLVLAITGLYTKKNQQWIQRMFLYSLNYLMLVFLLMIVVTTF
ncbi:heme o synthase [Aquibacillus sediminis]|uniref:heme o synthase n=1 Tax=Aquibacillus sediminis TaxID=2574734 RepID=UPI001108D330|nr:heme o synthase [Aquibacillus sediminis]